MTNEFELKNNTQTALEIASKTMVLCDADYVGAANARKEIKDVVKSYTDFINGLGWTVAFRQLSNLTWCACAHKWNNGDLTDSRYAFDDKDMVIALQELAHKILEVE